MTVLVTGATGTVGTHVVEALLAAGEPVRAASRDPAQARATVEADSYVAFDFEKPETWGEALAGVDRLFLVRPPNASSVSRITDFVDAAERTGVAHVVVLSVLDAERIPLLPHRRIERYIEGTDLLWTFLRASFFMQNFLDDRHEDVLHDELFVPAGDGEISFVDARDVADVAATVLTERYHHGYAYDLTGPESLTHDEVAAAFTDVLNRAVTYADPSLPRFAWRTYRRGVAWRKVLLESAIYTSVRFGFADRVTTDVRRVLDRKPTDFRTFVADHADAFAVERPVVPSIVRE